MEVEKIVQELEKKYPGKNIVLNTPDETTEIVCEVDPSKDKGLAIAVIDYIRPHYHRKAKETYKLLKGDLELFLSGEKRLIKEGETIEIFPKQVHWGFGDETWIEVVSKPGWTPEDHILAIDYQEISRAEYDKRFNN